MTIDRLPILHHYKFGYTSGRKKHLLPSIRGRILLICTICLIVVGTILVANSQYSYPLQTNSDITLSDLALNSQSLVTELDLHVDQVLIIESNVDNGTARFRVSWLGTTIRTGSYSDNPSLVFYVDGFSHYQIWMDVDSDNSNVTVDIIVQTNEYPLIRRFVVGAILLILGFLILAGLIGRDLMVNENEKGKSSFSEEKITQTHSFVMNNERKEINYMLVVILTFLAVFIFLAVTDPHYVHNDSVGYGLSGPPGMERQWKYEAWGYLDFANMVRQNLENSRYNYESWAIIHGSSKAIGLPIITGLISYLTSIDTFFVFRISVTIFFSLLCVVIGMIVYKLTQSKIGSIIGVLLTVSNPILLEYSRSLYSEIPIVALTSLAILILISDSRFKITNLILFGLLFCFAAAFKSVLVLAPVFLWLLLIVLRNAKNRHWNYRYLLNGFGFIACLIVTASFSYLVMSPMKWTNFTGKFFGVTQSTGWFANNPFWILHNIGYLAVFLVLQLPIIIQFGILAGFFLAKKDLLNSWSRKLFALFLIYLPFHLYESRLLQHHMCFSITIGIIVACVSITVIKKQLPAYPQNPKMKYSFFKIVLLSIVILDALFVLPWIPYSGVYLNPIGKAIQYPPYFEPVYGFDETSKIIETYPNDGYILTTGAAHVLSYYLCNRSVIYPVSNLIYSTSSSSVLTILLSSQVQFVVLTYTWLSRYQEMPFWISAIISSETYELIATISCRGVRFVDIYVLTSSTPITP